jgi:hypothetical protein
LLLSWLLEYASCSCCRISIQMKTLSKTLSYSTEYLAPSSNLQRWYSSDAKMQFLLYRKATFFPPLQGFSVQTAGLPHTLIPSCHTHLTPTPIHTDAFLDIIWWTLPAFQATENLQFSCNLQFDTGVKLETYVTLCQSGKVVSICAIFSVTMLRFCSFYATQLWLHSCLCCTWGALFLTRQ